MSMIKLPTTSSNDDDQIDAILRSFLAGRVALKQLRELLEHYMVIDFNDVEGYREIRDNALDGVIRIPVHEEHLWQMLQQYLSGQISALDLSDWAAFIFMSGVFVPKEETEEEQWQSGEDPVWDILQQLMTPAIFDGLNRQIVQNYCDMLLKSQ